MRSMRRILFYNFLCARAGPATPTPARGPSRLQIWALGAACQSITMTILVQRCSILAPLYSSLQPHCSLWEDDVVTPCDASACQPIHRDQQWLAAWVGRWWVGGGCASCGGRSCGLALILLGSSRLGGVMSGIHHCLCACLPLALPLTCPSMGEFASIPRQCRMHPPSCPVTEELSDDEAELLGQATDEADAMPELRLPAAGWMRINSVCQPAVCLQDAHACPWLLTRMMGALIRTSGVPADIDSRDR